MRRGFQDPDDGYDPDVDRGPRDRDADPGDDGDGWEPDERDLADYEADAAGRAALAYAADVTVRLPRLRALAEWVCDRPHRGRLAALVLDGEDVVLWHEGRTRPRTVRAAPTDEVGHPDEWPAPSPEDELPAATRVGSLDDLAAIPRGWQDPDGMAVTVTCPGCRRDFTAAPSGGTVAQMLYLGLLDIVEVNRLPAAVRDHLRPRRVAPRRGSALCYVAHQVPR